MANILQSTQQRNERREAFAKEKKDEREDLRQTCDKGIESVCGDAEKLAAFLRMMVTVPNYTSRNAMLVYQKMPDARHVESKKAWYDMGRYVPEEHKDKGIKILVGTDKGRMTFYDVKMVYDVSQTVGKPPKKHTIALAEDSPEMQKAFNGLAEHSPVPIVADETLAVPSLYDPQERVVLVNDGFSDYETFAAVVNANAHASLHNEDIRENRGQDRGYDPEATEFLTSCVTYVVCQRFGVPVPGMDFETPAQVMGSMDFEGKDVLLKIIGDNAKSCTERLRKEIAPNTIERAGNTGRSSRAPR